MILNCFMKLTRINYHFYFSSHHIDLYFISIIYLSLYIGIIDQNMRIKYDDTDEIRYNKMIAIATRYTIIQFGICLFHQDPSNDNTIIATSYNFYIFPHSAYNLDMTISTSAIDFLRKNNMDFNEWLTKGINYCDEKGEITAKTKYYPDGDGSSTAITATASAPIAPTTVTATSTTTVEAPSSTIITTTTEAAAVAPSSTTKKYIVLTKDSDIEFIEGEMIITITLYIIIIIPYHPRSL